MSPAGTHFTVLICRSHTLAKCETKGGLKHHSLLFSLSTSCIFSWFYWSISHFSFCSHEVLGIVGSKKLGLSTVCHEMVQAVAEGVCVEGVSHLIVNCSSSHTCEETAVLLSVPAPLDWNGSEVVDSHGGEGRVFRRHSVCWQVCHEHDTATIWWQ